jgi:hypothetical protein
MLDHPPFAARGLELPGLLGKVARVSPEQQQNAFASLFLQLWLWRRQLLLLYPRGKLLQLHRRGYPLALPMNKGKVHDTQWGGAGQPAR